MREIDLLGYWKIVEMAVWTQDYVDLVVPGFIEFEMEGGQLMGHFQFGTVTGWMDCRLSSDDGGSEVEWSWEGRSDSDPASGRGWASLDEDGVLVGRIFIHAGDESEFVAERQERPGQMADRGDGVEGDERIQ